MRLLGECEEMDQLLRSYHTINTINKHAQKPLGEKAAEKRVADIVSRSPLVHPSPR